MRRGPHRAGNVLTPQEKQGEQTGPQRGCHQPQQCYLHPQLAAQPLPSVKLVNLCQEWGKQQEV